MLLVAGACFAADEETLRSDAQRIEKRILELSQFGRNADGGVDRIAFSDADVAGRKYITGLMRDAGLRVRADTAGNIIGFKAGSDPELPVIMFGSHIDSVPGGGNYDGDLGVIAAIEAVKVLQENNVTTRHPLEVIVFSDEEGGLVGSRAMIGKLGKDALDVVSHTGKTIREGIRVIGGDPERLGEAQRKKGELAAFIELHIEQGAFLYEDGIDIGVVEGIVGINWWDVIIEGFANHAGTTPMNRRRDAMLAAAELTLAINKVVTGQPGRQVGTVGRIKAEPGAPNVIPGRVVMSLEIRDLSEKKMKMLFRQIEKQAKDIAQRTGTTIRFQKLDVASVPALTDTRMRSIIELSATSLGLSHMYLPSGAGHDAQEIAQIAPTGMIFVPSKDGISHSPNEFTSPEDMANGADVLLQTVLAVDRGALE
ncbi:MAG: Zn-dependent hydrolase [Gammaproteobacteria bacterium]|nr:Zn-dependent hydrolase [Gammaproteobacteria bacterium]